MSSNEEDPAVAWEAWLNEPDARWTCTRGELIDALTHLQASVPWPPPIRRDGTISINAESLADAILAGLTQAEAGKIPVDPEDLRALVGFARSVGQKTPEQRALVERMSEATRVTTP